MSTHPGYWQEMVADAPGSLVKRDSSTWRSLDRRWFAEHDKDSWLKRFQKLSEKKDIGLKKHYEYNQCLITV